MKPATFLVLAVLTNASGTAWSAEAEPGISADSAEKPGALVPRNIAAYEPRVMGDDKSDAAGTFSALDRSPFFIGNVIANLRGLDPTFGTRSTGLPGGGITLTALDLPATWTDAPISARNACSAGQSACGPADLLINRRDGSTQLLARGLNGDFIALPRSHRVFACSDGAASGGRTEPAIVDLNGTLTALPSHPGALRSCARTGSGDEVLLVYSLVHAGKPVSLARVFDGNGAMLAEGTYKTEGAVDFSVAGKKFSATVPGP